jgi:predicted unusual protein kinase regulating ubiquinone biosynthesis (AarF/ABC1/UbiB family)
MILSPRHFSRLAATVGLFTRYGLADFARAQGIDALAESDGSDGDRAATAETAAAFRRRLVELGPAYIKLGQVLSSRTDLLPEVYIRELERLQDDVSPLPFSTVAEVIESELGGRISKLFESIDEEPLGAASLGQAHAAVIRGGRDVVVKVQRPDIREPLAADLDFFRELAVFLTAHTAAGKRVDLVGIIQQLERALTDELDYRVEARNAAHFRHSLAEFPRLLAPRVIDGYSTERVLTTERIRGVKIDQVSPVTRTELDFGVLAEELTRAYLKQIVIEGHFHADPHPGNVFVLLPESENPPTPSEIVTYEESPYADEETAVSESPIARAEIAARDEAPLVPRDIDVKLALIDFGMTARLSTTMRDQCAKLLFGLADNQGDDVADVLVELGEPMQGFQRSGFLREISEVVGRASRFDSSAVDAGALLYEAINASFQRGLRLPAELTLLAKALVHLDVVTRTLDPAFAPVDTVKAYLVEIAASRARSRLNPRQLYRIVSESADLFGALPHRIDRITKRLANSDFETRLDVPQLPVLLEGMQKVANRVFSGLVLAGLLVASAMLLPHWKTLGTIGFLLAGLLALYMVVSILWSDHRRQRA